MWLRSRIYLRIDLFNGCCMPVTISFTDPFPLPDGGFRVGYRKKGTSDAYTYVTDAGPSPITINETNYYQDYEGTIESVCSGFYSESVPWVTNNFSTEWTVSDEWYVCFGEPCDGEAVYCLWYTLRRVSDDFLIFSGGFDGSGETRTGYAPTLEAGVAYKLEAEWFADGTKTSGFSSVSLTGNATSTTWVETGTGSVTHLITFLGVAGVNVIEVMATGAGPLCSCGFSTPLNVILTLTTLGHCTSGSIFTVYVSSSWGGVLEPGVTVYYDIGLTTPVDGYLFISELSGPIYDLYGTGVVGNYTGEMC